MKCEFCRFKKTNKTVKEFNHWIVHVADSQQYLGHLICHLKKHRENFVDLSKEELLEFHKIAKQLHVALNKIFKPDLYNYQQNGNIIRHIHFHIIPRYKASREFENRIFIDKNYGGPLSNEWIAENEEFLTKLARKIKEKI